MNDDVFLKNDDVFQINKDGGSNNEAVCRMNDEG